MIPPDLRRLFQPISKAELRMAIARQVVSSQRLSGVNVTLEEVLRVLDRELHEKERRILEQMTEKKQQLMRGIYSDAYYWDTIPPVRLNRNVIRKLIKRRLLEKVSTDAQRGVDFYEVTQEGQLALADPSVDRPKRAGVE